MSWQSCLALTFRWSRWRADIHCDVSIKLCSVDADHIVPDRVNAVAVHGLFCSGQTVEPIAKKKKEKEEKVEQRI